MTLYELLQRKDIFIGMQPLPEPYKEEPNK